MQHSTRPENVNNLYSGIPAADPGHIHPPHRPGRSSQKAGPVWWASGLPMHPPKTGPKVGTKRLRDVSTLRDG
jgi:hypothetical protein